MTMTPVPATAHKPTTTRFTYHRDVFPIFLSRCGSCHHEGGPAPMSLLEYEKTFPWAVAIKNQVLALTMPPWFVDGPDDAFRHSPSLTAREVDTVVDWCVGGTPAGEGTDPALNASATTPKAPDLVLTVEEPFLFEADATEGSHEALLQTGLRGERFLRSIEFRPEHANIARSALFYLVEEEPSARAQGERSESRSEKRRGWGPAALSKRTQAPFASWIAGEGAEVFDGGLRLPARAALRVRIQYRKTWLDEGKPFQDRSSVALGFSSDLRSEIQSLVATTGETRLERQVSVLSVLPLIEAPLDSLLVEAVLPGGKLTRLIALRSPDPAWPRSYRFSWPVVLPEGTLVRVSSKPAIRPLVVLNVTPSTGSAAPAHE
jgi:hypothetical protein